MTQNKKKATCRFFADGVRVRRRPCDAKDPSQIHRHIRRAIRDRRFDSTIARAFPPRSPRCLPRLFSTIFLRSHRILTEFSFALDLAREGYTRAHTLDSHDYVRMETQAAEATEYTGASRSNVPALRPAHHTAACTWQSARGNTRKTQKRTRKVETRRIFN